MSENFSPEEVVQAQSRSEEARTLRQKKMKNAAEPAIEHIELAMEYLTEGFGPNNGHNITLYKVKAHLQTIIDKIDKRHDPTS